MKGIEADKLDKEEFDKLKKIYMSRKTSKVLSV